MEARFPLRARGCGGASVMGGVIHEGSWNPCQSIVSKWRKQDSSAGFRDKAWKADGTNRIGYFDLDMKGSVASHKHPFVQASLLRRLLYATLKNTEVKSKKSASSRISDGRKSRAVPSGGDIKWISVCAQWGQEGNVPAKNCEKQTMLVFFFKFFSFSMAGNYFPVDKRQSELTPEVGRIIFYHLAYT